ncbi:MAG TPA: hypothetical protein VGM98_02405 [Schlesneria sp.]|jgi:hypothetical protein
MPRNNDESDSFEEDNPFMPPESDLSGRDEPDREVERDVTGMVMPPAVCLLVVAALGLMASIFNVVMAIVMEAPAVDPNAPPFVQGFQQGGYSVFAAIVHSGFFLLNLLIIFGGIQMLRLKNRTLGIAASVLAMMNFGTCCCLLGLPVGIWSLVILLREDVSKAFDDAAD